MRLKFLNEKTLKEELKKFKKRLISNLISFLVFLPLLLITLNLVIFIKWLNFVIILIGLIIYLIAILGDFIYYNDINYKKNLPFINILAHRRIIHGLVILVLTIIALIIKEQFIWKIF